MSSNITNQESKFQVSSIRNILNLTTLNGAGYGGYITGIKSENVYGETYGKTTLASSAKTFSRGMDQAPHVKY